MHVPYESESCFKCPTSEQLVIIPCERATGELTFLRAEILPSYVDAALVSDITAQCMLWGSLNFYCVSFFLFNSYHFTPQRKVSGVTVFCCGSL